MPIADNPVSRNRWCALAAAVLFACSLLATHAEAAERPNLVFVIADDCTFSDIGTYGGEALTPNMDKLAKQGMKFMRCYQAAPMCSPTRHNIYTGLYPVKSGAYPNHTFAKAGTKSIVHDLKPLGYRVMLSGKKHISPREVFPFEYTGKGNNPDMNAIDKLMAESKKAGTPFCLFACSNEPHSPWTKGDASKYPPAKLKLPPYIGDTPVMRDTFSRYLAEITYYDNQVGQIMALLDKHGLADNTLLMVVSEQGNGFPFAKWTCYDMGLHSAMLVRWPGKVKPGSVANAMVEYVDVLPTFVEAAGGKNREVLDGKSFMPVLMGKTDEHKQYTYGLHTTVGIINGKNPYPIRTVADGNYRLIWNINHEDVFHNALTQSEEFKSMLEAALAGNRQCFNVTRRYMHRPEWELFDMKADPTEQSNLYGKPEHAAITKTLKAKLNDWMAEQGDKGMETELKAREHQGRSRKKKGGNAGNKNAKKNANKQAR